MIDYWEKPISKYKEITLSKMGFLEKCNINTLSFQLLKEYSSLFGGIQSLGVKGHIEVVHFLYSIPEPSAPSLSLGAEGRDAAVGKGGRSREMERERREKKKKTKLTVALRGEL